MMILDIKETNASACEIFDYDNGEYGDASRAAQITRRLVKNSVGVLRRCSGRTDIIEDFPFMLRLSKHSGPFFNNLRDGRRAGLFHLEECFLAVSFVIFDG
jgi:hypothetical protein